MSVNYFTSIDLEEISCFVLKKMYHWPFMIARRIGFWYLNRVIYQLCPVRLSSMIFLAIILSYWLLRRRGFSAISRV